MLNRILPIVLALPAMALPALAAEKPVALHQRRADPARDGLVLEYRFEGSAADSSGGKRDGTRCGRPQFVPGKTGQCVALDGQQDYIDCGTTLAELGQTFTVECWVNPADRQNVHADLFGNHNHGGFGFAVEQDANNTNRFAGAFGAGAGRWVATRPVPLAAGKWQHLALVKRPGELRLYVNGIPAAVAASDAPKDSEERRIILLAPMSEIAPGSTVS